MKKSYAECIEIFNALNKLDLTADTKLKYAAIKVLKSVKLIAESYNERIQDLNIEYCYTDDKGVIAKDEKDNYIFKKEELKQREKAVKSLNKEEVEIKTHIIDLTEDIEKKINPYVVDLLRGILFPEESAE